MTCLHGTGRAYFTALAAVLGQLGDQTIGRKTARPRHFDLAQTASLAKITTAIKLKHGTFYDDIANGNTYDLNGNLTDNGAGQTYAWDAANRLISITQGSNVTAFVYNGLGQRVQEKLNGTLTKQWVWRLGGAQPAEERDGSNAVTKRFYGQGEQISGVAYFFTADHIGSIREMVDSTGLIRARYDYDPYGRITKVSGDLEVDFGFTDFYRHQASGLNLTLYRAYDPELGRWLSREPLGEQGPDGPNLYTYVRNDPVNANDPLGLARHPGESVSDCRKRFLQEHYGVALSVIDNLGYWGLFSGAFYLTLGHEAAFRTVERVGERALDAATRDAQIAGAMQGGSITARVAAAEAAGARVAALRIGLQAVTKGAAVIGAGATAFSVGARIAAAIDCSSEDTCPNKK